MIRNLYILLVLLLATSCMSTKKYNEQISRLHSPEELKADADYTLKKLKRYHPDLYWYISEEELDKQFEDLKASIQEPMSSREFYLKLVPLITSIRQGHTRVFPPRLKQTKEEKESKGSYRNPFRDFEFANINNQLVLTDNFGSDSNIIEGSRLLSVDDQKVEDMLKQYSTFNTGDGHNKTFVPQYTYSGFPGIYRNMNAPKDSVLLRFEYKDSLYAQYINCYEKKKKAPKGEAKDSIPLTKEQKKAAKKKRKKKFQEKLKYGEDRYSKERLREMCFLDSLADSSIAYLRIKSFFGKNHEDFYKECFAELDTAQSKYLIIDLRGNLGGSAFEIEDLYSYLTDKDFYFIEKAKMVRGINDLCTFYYNDNTALKIGALIFSPIILTNHFLHLSRKKGDPYYRITKKKKAKENNFKGKVYVLIDGMSFSSSCILSTNLHANKRATFVGEETGGAYNGTVAGRFIQTDLPNSRIRLNVGVMTLKAPYTTQPDGHGIKPDVYIPNTSFEEDEQLDWVLKNIKEQESKE